MRLTLARLLIGLAALFVTQFHAEAQRQQRLPHVGWLQNNSDDFHRMRGSARACGSSAILTE